MLFSSNKCSASSKETIRSAAKEESASRERGRGRGGSGSQKTPDLATGLKSRCYSFDLLPQRGERPAEMTCESDGQGLWSTVGDCLRFTRLFLGDGSVDGVHWLRPETLMLMMTNQLTISQRAGSGWFWRKPFAAGRGFGLGLSVVLETDVNDLMRRGGVGTVTWPGAYGGWWQADPNDGSVLIFMAHNMVDLTQMSKGIGIGVWAAIDAFRKSAADSQPWLSVSA